MAELSPEAQAVLEVVNNKIREAFARATPTTFEQIGGAAFRAAADLVEAKSIWIGHPEHTGVRWAADQLRAIAVELEAHHG